METKYDNAIHGLQAAILITMSHTLSLSWEYFEW